MALKELQLKKEDLQWAIMCALCDFSMETGLSVVELHATPVKRPDGTAYVVSAEVKL